MKGKWFLIVLTIVLLTIGGFSFFYNSIRSPINDESERARQYVLAETNIKEVDEIAYYNGSKHYQVITGKDDKGIDWIAWYNEEDDELIKRRKSEGLSEKEVLNIVNQQLKVKKLKSIRLGIENNLPVYEVTYIDDEDRYAYYYLTFNDGTFVKRYSLKQE